MWEYNFQRQQWEFQVDGEVKYHITSLGGEAALWDTLRMDVVAEAPVTRME